MKQDSHQDRAALDALCELSAALPKAQRTLNAANLQRVAEGLGWPWEEVSWLAGPRPKWNDPAHAQRVLEARGQGVAKAAAHRLSQLRTWHVDVNGSAYTLTSEELARLVGLSVPTLQKRTRGRGEAMFLRASDDAVEVHVWKRPAAVITKEREAAQLAELFPPARRPGKMPRAY